MSAVTRWVQYATSATTTVGNGDGEACLGTRGYSEANTAPTGANGDTASIGASNNTLRVNIDSLGATQEITLASGTDLDPRFISRDITEKLHDAQSNVSYQQAMATWENGRFRIYSGSLGSGSSVAVTAAGSNSAHTTLGFASPSEQSGAATSNSWNGGSTGLTASGTYYGLLDEMYRVVVSNATTINTPTKGGSNSYAGTMTTGGLFNYSSDITYTIEIKVSNGTTMGAGGGSVPEMAWTSTGSVDDSAADVELLYPNNWYNVGTKGLMVKFTDAVFNACNPAWTIVCEKPDYAQGTNTNAAIGTAEYIWSSTRGDDATAPLTTAATNNRVGSRGVVFDFATTSGNLYAGDEFYIICTGPQPYAYDITNLNYGNVTVSTESAVRCVLFEIMSGAVEMSTVKFGLQSHGSFTYHDGTNTKFRFGTLGPANNAGSSPTDGIEWYPNIVAADIDQDSPSNPSYLYATKEDLDVVDNADDSESIGVSHYYGMMADPVWLNIRLGASEVGANSTINYRIYFDYS